jgi:hypothetical protein
MLFDTEVAIETRGLRDVSDARFRLLRVAGGIDPEDLDAACRRRHDPGEKPNRRRLAGAVRSEQAKHLAPPYGKIEASDRDGRTVAAHETPDIDDGV